MKRVLLSIVLVFAWVTSSAQIQRGLQGSYVLDSFPKVSFVWNSPNPEALDASQFALFENDIAVDFRLTVLPVDKKKSVKKSVLILWEDMASHGRQSDFTRELLLRFFDETSLAKGDCFEVATFDRNKDTESGLLKPLLGQFTSDKQRVGDALSQYRKNSRHYDNLPMQSDLYQAINDGVAMLKKEPAERMGVIVVVTAGLNVKAAGASTEMETVRKNAREAGIPIYVVKYPIMGNAPEVNILAESTFGASSSTINVADALSNLQQQYRSMDERLLGRDYRFCFTAKGERDGKPHLMRIMVDKVRRPLPPYLAPNQTFGQWLLGHWWLALLIVVIAASGTVLTMRFVKKKNEEQEQAKLEMQKQMDETERRNRETVENMRREQEAKERASREAAERELAAAEEERLGNLMHTKNLYPRLQCMAGEETFVYTICKPMTTIGRNEENDVAFTMKNASFDNQTVSGYHAAIVFNGSAFEVINKSYTYKQGIIVNGQFYQQYTLRNGDMIGLGEAVMTFYI